MVVSISLHSAGIRTLVTEMSLSCPSWWMEDNWVKYIGSAPITDHTHQQTRPPATSTASWLILDADLLGSATLHSAQIISSVFVWEADLDVLMLFVRSFIVMLIMMGWLDDRKTWWLGDLMTIWPYDQMTRWPDDQMTRCPDDRMTGWQDDRITG